eukprot:624718-Pleurochrysis_carterae.AAC.1
MSTRVVAELKLELIHDLARVLKAEWGMGLSLLVRTELSISYADYDKLRLAFCKRFDVERDM